MQEPLVAIIVITYNSGKYIIELLESARAQTYQNIELIITDDCSTDNTLDLCREWIKKNGDRFIRVSCITSKENTGVAPNANRGLDAAKGEWLKFIAGDDMLHEDAIDSFVSVINSNREIEFLVSDMYIINQEGVFLNILKHNKDYFTQNSFNKQYRIALKEYFVKAPGIFILKNCLVNIGGFDENYPFMEDYPLLIKLSKQGTKFFHIDKPLVYYRKNETSIWSQFNSDTINAISLKHFNSSKLFCYNILLPGLWREKFYLTYLSRLIQIIIEEKRIKQNRLFKVYKYLRFLDLLYLFNLFVAIPKKIVKIFL